MIIIETKCLLLYFVSRQLIKGVPVCHFSAKRVDVKNHGKRKGPDEEGGI